MSGHNSNVHLAPILPDAAQLLRQIREGYFKKELAQLLREEGKEVFKKIVPAIKNTSSANLKRDLNRQ